jgi:hypothetical protein
VNKFELLKNIYLNYKENINYINDKKMDKNIIGKEINVVLFNNT